MAKSVDFSVAAAADFFRGFSVQRVDRRWISQTFLVAPRPDGGLQPLFFNGSVVQPGFRARLYPIHSISMRLERTNVLDRTIGPLGLNEPLVSVPKHKTE
jgi:hypothetical protein